MTSFSSQLLESSFSGGSCHDLPRPTKSSKSAQDDDDDDDDDDVDVDVDVDDDLESSRINPYEGRTHNKNCIGSNSHENVEGEMDNRIDDDPWTFRGKRLKHLDFPLGGIGSGNILLQGDGCLRGWDVLNQFHNLEHRPLHNPPSIDGKGSTSSNNNCNYWAISAAYDDDDENINTTSHESEEQQSEPVQPWEFVEKLPRQSLLLRSANHYGLREHNDGDEDERNFGKRPPDVPEISVRARYPIAEVSYTTPPSFPLTNITMEAMTPFVPTDARASAYPMAVFVVRFENPHPTKSVSVDVMQSTINFLGWDGGRKKDGVHSCLWGGNLNEGFVHESAPQHSPPVFSCQGLFLHTERELKEDLTRKGSIALSAILPSKSNAHDFNATEGSSTIPGPPYHEVGLITAVPSEEELFRRFHARSFEFPSAHPVSKPSPDGTTYAGAVVQSLSKIPPSSGASVAFCLSWHFPYRPCTAPRANLPQDFYGNLYANWFADAREVAESLGDDIAAAISAAQETTEDPQVLPPASEQKLEKNKKNLLEITRLFVETLYGSTVPYEVLESAAGRLAIARSPTLFRTEAGVVLGTGGNACGPLNGTYIYGYTTLLERIFPGLAMDMLTSVFVRNFNLPSGGCLASFGEGGFVIDGALASIAKVYLAVQQSDPGLDFLKTVWPNLKRQMGLILDKQITKDGVITGPQQTMYGGIQGANTLVGSYLVTALRSTEAMANLVGDVNFAKKCSKQVPISLAGYEQLCWREDFGYYVANTDHHGRDNHNNSNNTADNYSYGNGCCIDQLAAIGISRACGFGCVFDPAREARALRSIVRNNKVTNPPFADEDSNLGFGDSGIRVCTYPHNRGDTAESIPSCDKVASGLEYSLVAGLIGEGNREDALTVCSMIRHRQSGVRKSPWNEPEQGSYAARSMAGWNLFDQACGYSYDSTKASIGFLPKLKTNNNHGDDADPYDFSCFCSFHGGFGKFQQQQKQKQWKQSINFGGSNIAGTSSSDDTTITTIAVLKVLYGSLELKTIHLDDAIANSVVASLDHQDLNASIAASGVVALGTKTTIGQDSTLKLTLKLSSRKQKNASSDTASIAKELSRAVSLTPIARKITNWWRLLYVRCILYLLTLYWILYLCYRFARQLTILSWRMRRNAVTYDAME